MMPRISPHFVLTNFRFTPVGLSVMLFHVNMERMAFRPWHHVIVAADTSSRATCITMNERETTDHDFSEKYIIRTDLSDSQK